MGAQIIEAIQSGLGLMSNITKELLNGFTTLFWDTSASDGAGALTTLGMFALVFLGISITFAVVKLALNLIRSNTGL